MKHNRRSFIGNSGLGLFGLTPLMGFSENWLNKFSDSKAREFIDTEVGALYPTTDPNNIQAVVGAAHTQFDKVKELVNARPELAKATFDWGFGDVESALGAASHMGRKDIAEFLIDKGARPNILTFAMLGKLGAVKSMIEDMPGIEKILGPHGFTLLFHAEMRLKRKNVEGAEKQEQEALVEYLKTINGANINATSLDITEEERQTYYGTYKFGEGEDEYFEVKLSGMGSLSMARGEYFGRTLNRVDTHVFAPGGAPSVRIHFEIAGGSASSLTIHDPMPLLKANRI